MAYFSVSSEGKNVAQVVFPCSQDGCDATVSRAVAGLSLCLVSSTQHGPKLSLYLHEMLHDHKDSLSKDEQNAVGVFMTSLKLCGHRCIPPNAAHKQDLLKAIKEVCFQCLSQDTENSKRKSEFSQMYPCRRNSSMKQRKEQAEQLGRRSWSTPRESNSVLLDSAVCVPP